MVSEPERTVAVESELAGRRVTLRVERVVLEDGTETVRDVVQHPNSVVIVPLEDDGSVVMVRQYRKAAGRELLEFPAGMIEGDASPVDAARRELREETGLDARELIELGSFFAAPGSLTERLHAFPGERPVRQPACAGRRRAHHAGARAVRRGGAPRSRRRAERRQDAGLAPARRPPRQGVGSPSPAALERAMSC